MKRKPLDKKPCHILTIIRKLMYRTVDESPCYNAVNSGDQIPFEFHLIQSAMNTFSSWIDFADLFEQKMRCFPSCVKTGKKL